MTAFLLTLNLRALDTESIKDAFHKLTAEEKRSFFTELKKEFGSEFDDYITDDGGVSSIIKSLSQRFEIKSGLLPREDGESYAVQALDENGSEIRLEVERRNGVIYVKNGGIIRIEQSNIINLDMDAESMFFKALLKEYMKICSIEKLIQNNKIDEILSRINDVDEKDYFSLINLQYKIIVGDKISYGMFIHKLVESCIPQDNIINIIQSLKKSMKPSQYINYLKIVNNAELNAYQISKARFPYNQKLTRFLANELRIEFDGENVNTHNAAVNKSAFESFERIARIFCSRSDAMIGSEKFQDIINEQIRKAHSELQKLSQKEPQELFEYIKPALDKNLKNLNIDDALIKAELMKVKSHIDASLRLFDDVINKGHLSSEHGNYPILNDVEASNGLTHKEMLALSYYALHDVENHLADSGHTNITKMLQYLSHLHNIRREYSAENDREDKNKCPAGAINSLIASLNGVHKDAVIKVLIPALIKNDLAHKMRRYIVEHFNEFIAAIDVDKRSELFIIWKAGGNLNLSFISDDFKNKMLADIQNIMNAEYQDLDWYDRQGIRDDVLKKLSCDNAIQAALNNYNAQNANQPILCDIHQVDLKTFINLYTQAPEILLNVDGEEVYIWKAVSLKKKVSSLTEPEFAEIKDVIFSNVNFFNVAAELIFISEADMRIKLSDDYLRSLDNQVKLRLFFMCLKNNWKDTFIAILGMGISVDSRMTNGWTALHIAARQGNKEMVELLLARGAEIGNKAKDGWTALHIAVSKGNKEIVEMLLARGASVREAEKNGWTALHLAVELGDKEIVELLLARGANINDILPDRRTALHIAVSKGNKEIVEMLLARGASVREAEKNGWTALHIAVELGDKEIVQLLLAKGANINDILPDRRTALHIAARQGHKEIVELLLARGASVREAEKNGRTALHLAARQGHKEIVELLLARGANINDILPDRSTALHIAVEMGNKEMVELLLARGAEIGNKAKDGWTALHIAVSKGNKEIVEMLLARGANINDIKEDGRTALHLAVLKGHIDIVKLLLEKRANIENKENIGWTALHIAVLKGHINIVKLLLERGANVNETDAERRTALHFAADKGHKDIVKLLLESGANIENQIKDGRTALHFAITTGNTEVIKLLLESGANIENQIKDGRTALHIAVLSKRTDIIQLLLEKRAKIENKANGGRTALHVAADKGHKDIVELLLERDANVNETDAERRTALHFAADKGHKDIVKLLLAKGAKIENKANGGRTALHMAVLSKRIGIVKLLLAKDAKIENKANDGRTALHIAITTGNTEVIKLLLESGANIESKAKNGRTALHMAVLSKRIGIIELLLQHRAKIDIADQDGLTPLDMCNKFKFLATNITMRTMLETYAREEASSSLSSAAEAASSSSSASSDNNSSLQKRPHTKEGPEDKDIGSNPPPLKRPRVAVAAAAASSSSSASSDDNPVPSKRSRPEKGPENEEIGSHEREQKRFRLADGADDTVMAEPHHNPSTAEAAALLLALKAASSSSSAAAASSSSSAAAASSSSSAANIDGTVASNAHVVFAHPVSARIIANKQRMKRNERE